MAIDVGPVCADKGDVWDITMTFVSDENAANDTGTIDYLCTFLSSQGSNVEVASFAHAGSNVLSTNGTASLGTVASGLREFNAPGDFTAFNINTGEFIGIYGTDGDIETDTNGASGGAWYKSGDYIPATSESFSHNDNYGPALYGTGTAAGGTEHEKSLSDTINLSDIYSTSFGHPEADSVNLSDGITKSFGIPKGDTISLSDEIVKNFGMTKADTIMLSDVIIKSFGLNKADSISLSDSATVVVEFLRSLSDIITLSDGIAKNFGTPKADIISITDDLVSMLRAILRSFSDTINLSDGVIKNIGIVKDDTVNISDSFNRVIIYLRSLDDTISISDSEILGIGLNKSDIITLSDGFAKEVVAVIVVAPDGRSILVVAEVRFATVAAENRYIHVGVEDRIITVVAS